MKIIKEGKLPNPKVYRGACTNCGTEVEADWRETEYIGKNEDGSDCMGVRCPLKSCHCKIVVRKIS